MQRLGNDKIGRLLHQQLYERLVKFCEAYTPEFPAEPVVDYWLSRVFFGDESIHILFDVDEKFNVSGHCVITIQEAYGFKAVFCHQIQSEMVSKTINPFAEECLGYIGELRDAIGASCSIVYVEKNAKVYEKKLGYKAVRTVLLQYNSQHKAVQEMEKDV